MKHNIFEDCSVSTVYPNGKRKTIFELYLENNTMERDFGRINTLFETVIYGEWYTKCLTLKEMASDVFRSWKHSGRCLSFSDYLNTIEYDSLVSCAPHDANDFITYIELVYNMLYLCNSAAKRDPVYSIYPEADIRLRDLMDEVLSEMNQKKYQIVKMLRILFPTHMSTQHLAKEMLSSQH